MKVNVQKPGIYIPFAVTCNTSRTLQNAQKSTSGGSPRHTIRRQLQVLPLIEPKPEPEQTRTYKLNYTNYTNEPKQALLYRPKTNTKITQSYIEPKASIIASSYRPKPINQNPINPRPFYYSLIPNNNKPKFNLKYL